MPPIQANVTNSQISASVGETKIDVSVSGGVGPTGAQGAPGATDYTQLANVPSSFSPSAHASRHAASGSDPVTIVAAQVSDFSSAVVAAAPPTVDASLLTQGTLSASRLPASGVAAGTYTSVAVDTTGRVTAGGQNVVGVADVTGLQAALDSKQAAGSYALTNDSRLSDSREWSAATVSQADAEAGTSTSRFAFTPARVFQAIVAWWSGSAAAAKLAGVAANATANSTDAQLRDRATHTGTQTASTISDFVAAASAAAVVQSVAGRTGTVTLAKADVGLSAVDNTADSAKPVSTAQAAADAAVQAAAASDATTKANAAQAHAIQRANHTGSQAISTVSGLQAALDSKQPGGSYATLTDGKVPAAQLPSYVDDVIEAVNLAALPAGGETGKIYVTLDSNKTYRWSGSAYIEISPSPGSTDAVAEGSTNLYYTNARASAAAPVQSVAGRTGAVTLGVADVANAVSTSDSRLTDSREWSAATASQADAEAGTSTSRFAFTPVRVFQAIAAWWAASSAKTKLDGIATNATANSSDATLLARANHTGTQAWSTITSTPTTLSGYGITDAVGSSDARLTDARTPTSHVHGNITNAGAIGSTSGQIVVTTTSGVLTTAATISSAAVTGLPTAGTGSSNYCAGNDSRLSDARTPTAHKTSHATGGSDALTAADIGAAAVSHTHVHSDVGNALATLTQFTADQNNLSLGSGGIIRISSNAARNVTGFAATSSGDARLLINVGTFAITLKHASGLSSEANRILCVDSADLEIKPNGSVAIVYDGTDSRWRAG